MPSGPLPKQGGQACSSSIRQGPPRLDKAPHVGLGAFKSLGTTELRALSISGCLRSAERKPFFAPEF